MDIKRLKQLSGLTEAMYGQDSKSGVYVPRDTWVEIKDALESATGCDHDLVREILNDIERYEQDGRIYTTDGDERPPYEPRYYDDV